MIRCAIPGAQLAENIEGEGQQRVAGEDCGGLIKGPMHGGLAAPQIVIIHGRQVIMDERITMYTFQRGGGLPDGLIIAAQQPCRFDDQKRAQALAASQRSVAHCSHQPGRTRNLAGQRRIGEQDC